MKKNAPTLPGGGVGGQERTRVLLSDCNGLRERFFVSLGHLGECDGEDAVEDFGGDFLAFDIVRESEGLFELERLEFTAQEGAIVIGGEVGVGLVHLDSQIAVGVDGEREVVFDEARDTEVETVVGVALADVHFGGVGFVGVVPAVPVEKFVENGRNKVLVSFNY